MKLYFRKPTVMQLYYPVVKVYMHMAVSKVYLILQL